MMDLIAEPLSIAVDRLSAQQISYEIAVSKPAKLSFSLCSDCLYVVRQTKDSNGMYHLVAAAKMEKEV